MSQGTQARFLALLALLPALLLAGCSAKTSVSCKPTFSLESAPRTVGSVATVAILPFGFVDEVPEGFARMAGERLSSSLSGLMPGVLSPAGVISAYQAQLGRPWEPPGRKEDFEQLGRIVGDGVAVCGTATRYVYGSLIASEIAFSIVLVDLASGESLAGFDAQAVSRKGFSYTGLSKPPQRPEELLGSIMNQAAAAIKEALEKSEKRPRS